MNEIVFIALEIKHNKENNVFHARPANEQIELLDEKIKIICADLEQKHPQANWIIAWREYGIKHESSLHLSQIQKQYFKQKMQGLSLQFPQLILIAGTISYFRKVNGNLKQTKLSAIKNYYLNQQENKVNAFAKQSQLQKINEFDQSNDPILILRNVCYVFRGGECQIRHDKAVPFKQDLSFSANSIFQPGNKKTMSHIINVSIDSKVGIELCREHICGLLKAEVEQSNQTLPILHLILSEGMSIEKKYIAGKFVMLLDNNMNVELIDANPALAPIYNVSCYRTSLNYAAPLTEVKSVAFEQATTIMPELFNKLATRNIKVINDYLLHEATLEDINKSWNNNAPLAFSARLNNLDGVAALLEFGAEPNCFSEEGLTPLHYAIKHNNLDLVKILLQNGADLNLPAKGPYQVTALQFASYIKRLKIEIINLLAEYNHPPLHKLIIC